MFFIFWIFLHFSFLFSFFLTSLEKQRHSTTPTVGAMKTTRILCFNQPALRHPLAPNLFHTRVFLQVDDSLVVVVLNLLVAIAKILVHPLAAPCLTAWSMRLDLRNVRDAVPDSVELVDPESPHTRGRSTATT